MVTLRTEEENIDECQTTLRFAQRAKVKTLTAALPLPLPLALT